MVIAVGVLIGSQGGGLGTMIHTPLALIMIVLGGIGLALNVFLLTHRKEHKQLFLGSILFGNLLKAEMVM